MPRRREELPPPNISRWTPRRKAAVVESLLAGRITPAQVYDRYGLSTEELATWLNLYRVGGQRALSVIRIPCYRKHEKRNGSPKG